MSYQIRVTNAARKSLESLPENALPRIEVAIDNLAETPSPSGVKKLSGVKNRYRVRVGDYRIVYSVFDEILVVEIVAVGQRGGIYKSR